MRLQVLHGQLQSQTPHSSPANVSRALRLLKCMSGTDCALRNPVGDQHAGDVRQGEMFGATLPHSEILCVRMPWVIAQTVVGQLREPEHHGGMDQRAPEQQPRPDFLRIHGRTDKGPVPVAANDASPRAAYPDFRIPVQESNLPLEASRQAHVVGIHAGDVIAPREGKAPVERIYQAEVAVIHDDPHAGIPVRAKRRESPIGGTVVDRQQFEIGEGLAEDAPDGFVEVYPPVVDGKKNRDSRAAHTRTHESGSRSAVSIDRSRNHRSGARTRLPCRDPSQAPHQLKELFAMM